VSTGSQGSAERDLIGGPGPAADGVQRRQMESDAEIVLDVARAKSRPNGHRMVAPSRLDQARRPAVMNRKEGQRLMREHALRSPKRSEGPPAAAGLLPVTRPDESGTSDMTSVGRRARLVLSNGRIDL